MQVLDLSHNRMSTVRVGCISRAEWPMLSSLNISHNIVFPMAVEALVSADWPQLTHLDISGCRMLSAADMKTLATSQWPLLKSMGLGGIRMEPAVFRNMSCGNWPVLEKLDVSSARGVNIAGLQWLCKGNWPNMRSISFRDCQLALNASGGRVLCTLASANWPMLHTLDLSENAYYDGSEHVRYRWDAADIIASIVELLRVTWPGMRNLWLPETDRDSKQVRVDLSKLTAPVTRVFDYFDESRPGKPQHGMYVMAVDTGL